MEWNKKMKEARRNAKYTQQELADVLGVHRSTIANYELGRRKPTFMELKKIATKLHVDVNYLVEGDEVNEATELINRASTLFADVDIPAGDKDKIFQDIMKLYLSGKEKSKE